MRIFVISLKDLKERRKSITAQMKKLGISFEFFDAFDGRKGLPKKHENMIDRKLARKQEGRDLSDAEFSCALSHYFVWQKIVAEKIPNAIVLEDDVLIQDDFKELIKKKYLEKSKADMIMLYHIQAIIWKPSITKLFGKYNMAKIIRHATSTAGYYITNATAEKMIERQTPVHLLADSHKFKWGDDFNAFALYPRIIQHPPYDVKKSNLYSHKKNILSDSRKMYKLKQLLGKITIIPFLFFPQFLGNTYDWRYRILKPWCKKVSHSVEGE